MKESIELKETFNTTASVMYEVWLNSLRHSHMTGGTAVCSDQVGGSFKAWDGYITGTNISLTEDQEIVQSWRTDEFEAGDEDSKLTIQLKDTEGGCEFTLIHTNIPEGQAQYKSGWEEHYFAPMKIYFGE
jgi:activator of HSP90 ATPase